jgi:hypothetical protein
VGVIVNSTIANNSADYGGGIRTYGNQYFSIINTTISQNEANIRGGGIFLGEDDRIYIVNSAIVNNTANTDGEDIWGPSDILGLYIYYSWYDPNKVVISLPASITTETYAPNITTAYSSGDLGDPDPNGGFNNTMKPDASAPNLGEGTLVYYNDTDGYYFYDENGTGRLLTDYSSAPTSGSATDVIINDQKYGIRPDDPDIGVYELGATKRYYVDKDASGDNSGRNWYNAFTSLESALSRASFENEIWVAEGTYKPTRQFDNTRGLFTIGSPRLSTFVIPSGVKLYGGFAGDETSIDDREYFRMGETNETILCGDIGTEDDNSDNSYHVAIQLYNKHGTIIDGLSFTQGNGDDNDNSPLELTNISGGGLYSRYSDFEIRNCSFYGNEVLQFGGGLYAYDCNFNVINTSFKGNSSTKEDAHPLSYGD